MSKILLVEDDNNLREIYEARLQAEGYQIVSANDGESALVVAKNEKPDLIISDVMMPKISGFEMLDILRNTDGLKDVKVIMLTALGQADDQARANQLGADRYLVKSQVTLEDIVKVSHELLEGAAPAEAVTTDESAPTETPAAEVPPTPTEPVAPEAQVSSIPVASAPAEAEATSQPAANDSSVVPNDDLTAEAPQPVAAEPTDTPAAPAEPPAQPQTSAQEENDVAKQIEDFVASQPAEAPAAVEPTVTEEASAAPEVTTPETSPMEPPASLGDAIPAGSNDAATQAADDKMLNDAVETLVAGAEPAAASPPSEEAATENSVPAPSETATTPQTPTDASANEDTSPENDAVAVNHKKIIQPLDSTPKPDLDALLAAEEAREQAATPPAMPEPVVGTANEDEQPSGAPTPPPSSRAETGGPDKPIDPNSIAL